MRGRIPRSSPLKVSIRNESKTEGFLGFLLLGVRHILTGYDHLLFLFGLLVMCRTGRAAALLITCFTAAHSLTLALSTFGLVNLPSRFVEAAIAASILYVGLENIVRREKPISGRALLTFAFGLDSRFRIRLGAPRNGRGQLWPVSGDSSRRLQFGRRTWPVERRGDYSPRRVVPAPE